MALILRKSKTSKEKLYIEKRKRERSRRVMPLWTRIMNPIKNQSMSPNMKSKKKRRKRIFKGMLFSFVICISKTHLNLHRDYSKRIIFR
jgi:hypothetical protein